MHTNFQINEELLTKLLKYWMSLNIEWVLEWFKSYVELLYFKFDPSVFMQTSKIIFHSNSIKLLFGCCGDAYLYRIMISYHNWDTNMCLWKLIFADVGVIRFPFEILFMIVDEIARFMALINYWDYCWFSQ